MIIPETEFGTQKQQKKSFLDMVQDLYGSNNNNDVSNQQLQQQAADNEQKFWDAQPEPSNNPIRNANGVVPGFDPGYTGPVAGGGFQYDGRTPPDQEQSAATVIPQRPQKQARTSDQILQQIMGYQMPKPTFDANRPEELRRLSRNNAIAKALGLIGDMVGVKKGANINVRPNDNMEAKYTNDLMNYVDQMNRRQDEYNFREYAQKLRNGELLLNQANKDEDQALAQDRWEKSMANSNYWNQQKLLREDFWNEVGRRNKLNDQELTKKRDIANALYRNMTLEEQHRRNVALEVISQARANAAKDKAGKTADTKSYKIYSKAGKEISIPQDEKYYLLSLIVNDPGRNYELTKQEWDMFDPTYGEPLSTNSINSLVSKYWESSPMAKEYLVKRGYDTGEEKTTEQEQIKEIPSFFQ